MEQAYAQALERLASTKTMGESELYEKLRAHLVATGRLKLLPGLLRELRKGAAQRTAQASVLEVASEGERTEAEAAAKALGVDATAQVNPDLIRGWKLTADGVLTDRSARHSLIDLYRRVTS
jgi:F0F1-type ATP synthase delta subunit